MLVVSACGAGASAEPLQPKRQCLHWFEYTPSLPNEHEVLLYTLLMLKSEQHSVTKLKEWSSIVLSRMMAYGMGRWQMPEEWKTKGSKVPEIFEPIADAYAERTWHEEDLTQIGKAMQAWRGAGRIDDLDSGRIKKHLASHAKAPSADPKAPKKGPPRWKTVETLIGTATLINHHMVELRKLLHLDVPLEEVPTVEQELAEARARIGQLELELEQETAAKARLRNAHRMAWERNRTKVLERRAAVKAAKLETKAKLDADMKGKIAAATARVQEKHKRKLDAVLETADAAAEAKHAEKLARARARARAHESLARLAGSRLRRVREAEDTAAAAQLKLEELAQRYERERPPERPASPQSGECDQKTLPGTDGRRRADGRFVAEQWQARVLKWAQLGRGVAPSLVNANITEVLTIYAPFALTPQPCERQMRKLRSEVTVAGEMLAALRVALAIRIISFGFDESTKWGLGLLSTNTQIEPHDAPGTSVDVVMRGATLTAGGTAEKISKEIEDKLFAHARRLLTIWQEQHERMFGSGSWGAARMPLPDRIGLHRLSENAVIMSDTCNAARATKRLVAEMAEVAGRKRIGDEAWDKMTEEERDKKCKCHLGDCHQHLRNIIIKAMASEATDYLKDTLSDTLAEFSKFERMSADGMDLIRAACKELHPNGEYAKGKGRESKAWREKLKSSELWLPLENASGSRMDMSFDGAVPLYMDRQIILEFLHGLVDIPGADNILEKFLWRTLSCNEMTALLRVCTLFQLIATEPLRWLTGKSSTLEDWSMVSSNRLLDIIYDLMVKVAEDGHVLLDPELDPFAPIAAEQPKFAARRAARMRETVTAPDGTRHRSYVRTLEEARDPTAPGNQQSTPIMVELAQRMANGALVAMRDAKRAIAAKLTSEDGDECVAKSARVHEATKGAHVMNDHVETNYGIYDQRSRTFRNCSAENISGMVQQARNGDFDMPLNVASDRRKRKAGEEMPAQPGGFFWSDELTDKLRVSLVAAVRKHAETARVEGRTALAAHDEAKLARREERVIMLLNAAVDQYAYAKELFEQWQAQGAKDAKEIDSVITGKPEAQQLEYLRLQIEMRVLGLGWTQYATRWSSKSDISIGTVAHLRALLVDEILPNERAEARLKRLPTEAQPPQFTARNLGQLGTLDADAAAIQSTALFSKAELEAKAAEAVKRREAAGISDSVERMNGVSGETGAPAFDQRLVGKQIEVLWKYHNKDTGEPILIWATGRVARVADGLTDKKSKRAKKVLPAGMVLWAWDADPEFGEAAGEAWLHLLPQKWNKQVVYAWRYDPRELSPAAAARPRDERRKNAVCEGADE